VPSRGSCLDGLHNNGETDVDCGGDVCHGCGVGQQCVAAADCARGHCDAGTGAVTGWTFLTDVCNYLDFSYCFFFLLDWTFLIVFVFFDLTVFFST
jgi:hypothetical protein